MSIKEEIFFKRCHELTFEHLHCFWEYERTLLVKVARYRGGCNVGEITFFWLKEFRRFQDRVHVFDPLWFNILCNKNEIK